MGDVDEKNAKVEVSTNNEYRITMPDGDLVSIEFSTSGDLVQTKGTPLDSNTLHSISEKVKRYEKNNINIS